nr:hypothetical protein [Tanacetum cinerariifolium]
MMEQYLALTRGNQEPGVVKPEIGGNVNFKIKSQFMRELREDTFYVKKMMMIMNTRISNDSSARFVAITNKLDSHGRDMKKLKENVHAIQVGCENCGGAHLNKECLLHEEFKSAEEVKYGEFRRPFLNNGNGARYCVGPPKYYTRVDNRPPFSEKKPSL